MTGRVVVVGAGLAGFGVVRALRTGGHHGEVVLLGAERAEPYDHPPLSKAVLLAPDGAPAPDTTLTPPLAELAVDARLGVTATGLTPTRVRTDAGDIAYDRLVIATGAEPVRLAGAGACYLRTRADAVLLRDRLRPGARVVVVGAGWIGAEVATAAAHHGGRVTVVEAAAEPVGRVLPAEVGRQFRRWYAAAGVDLRCGALVRELSADAVTLAGGARIPADVVVVGVGVRPATGWLAGSGLPGTGPGEAGGIPVDARLAVQGGPGWTAGRVYAVGDVAARWSPRYAARIRGEHWDDALRAPEVVAANLRDGDASYDPVPYVWSEQFGRMVQYAGRHEGAARLVWRGDPAGDGWTACWLAADDTLAAVLAVDRHRDLTQARKLAAARTPLDPDRLADPAVPVRAAAR